MAEGGGSVVGDFLKRHPRAPGARTGAHEGELLGPRNFGAQDAQVYGGTFQRQTRFANKGPQTSPLRGSGYANDGVLTKDPYSRDLYGKDGLLTLRRSSLGKDGDHSTAAALKKAWSPQAQALARDLDAFQVETRTTILLAAIGSTLAVSLSLGVVVCLVFALLFSRRPIALIFAGINAIALASLYPVLVSARLLRFTATGQEGGVVNHSTSGIGRQRAKRSLSEIVLGLPSALWRGLAQKCREVVSARAPGLASTTPELFQSACQSPATATIILFFHARLAASVLAFVSLCLSESRVSGNNASYQSTLKLADVLLFSIMSVTLLCVDIHKGFFSVSWLDTITPTSGASNTGRRSSSKLDYVAALKAAGVRCIPAIIAAPLLLLLSPIVQAVLNKIVALRLVTAALLTTTTAADFFAYLEHQTTTNHITGSHGIASRLLWLGSVLYNGFLQLAIFALAGFTLTFIQALYQTRFKRSVLTSRSISNVHKLVLALSSPKSLDRTLALIHLVSAVSERGAEVNGVSNIGPSQRYAGGRLEGRDCAIDSVAFVGNECARLYDVSAANTLVAPRSGIEGLTILTPVAPLRPTIDGGPAPGRPGAEASATAFLHRDPTENAMEQKSRPTGRFLEIVNPWKVRVFLLLVRPAHSLSMLLSPRLRRSLSIFCAANATTPVQALFWRFLLFASGDATAYVSPAGLLNLRDDQLESILGVRRATLMSPLASRQTRLLSPEGAAVLLGEELPLALERAYQVAAESCGLLFMVSEALLLARPTPLDDGPPMYKFTPSFHRAVSTAIFHLAGVTAADAGGLRGTDTRSDGVLRSQSFKVLDSCTTWAEKAVAAEEWHWRESRAIVMITAGHRELLMKGLSHLLQQTIVELLLAAHVLKLRLALLAKFNLAQMAAQKPGVRKAPAGKKVNARGFADEKALKALHRHFPSADFTVLTEDEATSTQNRHHQLLTRTVHCEKAAQTFSLVPNTPDYGINNVVITSLTRRLAESLQDFASELKSSAAQIGA